MDEASSDHTPAAIVRANGIDLCYETFGSRVDPPLVLVMGLAAQMILWDDEFCVRLARERFWVIRFDNRDIGRSTTFPKSGSPNWLSLALTPFTKKFAKPTYTLRDMANDTLGLMDALGIARAHVVGASMGGMIAQVLALEHPERLLSLTSIMSTPGDPHLPRAEPHALAALMKPTKTDRASYVTRYMETWSVLAGPVLPLDPEHTRAQGERGFARGINPSGAARQMKAIVAADDRTAALGALRVPTLVIHGSADALVPLAHGRATANAIPGSTFEIVDGMGHALPRAAWPQLISAIVRHARATAVATPA